MLDVRLGIARQYCNRTKTDLMIEQLANIGTYSFCARATFFVYSLIAVNVERDADMIEEAAFQKLNVPIRQDGEIGLDGIPVFESGAENLVLKRVHFHIKFERDQKRLAAVPDEIHAFDG